MDYITTVLPIILQGLKITLGLFAITIVGAVPLGMLVSIGLRSQYLPVVRWVLNGYVWVMRGTPLLLQLIFVYYGSGVLQLPLSREIAAIVAFILNYAAYFAEIFRGGIQAVPQGQSDAAHVLGLSQWQAFWHIRLPQVTKIITPAIGNEVISLVKDTSLVYVIGLSDILRNGYQAAIRDVSLWPYALVGIIYLIITAIIMLMLRRCEARQNIWR